MSRGGASDWSVITVTHNSAEHLRRCWSRAEIGDAEWIVVDNASTDDSVQVARSLGARVIERPDNRGFGVANNAALESVERPFVAFVNPDVVIASPDDLDRLATTAETFDALVAPQLLNVDGSEQLNARGLPFPTAKLANRGIRLPGVDPAEYARAGFVEPTYIAWAMGAAFAGKTELFRQLGGWDERYFIYYEDHDIGLRSWLAGHTVVLDPEVRWTHEWQRETTGFKLAPWKHEFASMRVFYRTYPALRSRRRAVQNRLMRELAARIWTSPSGPVQDAGSGAGES